MKPFMHLAGLTLLCLNAQASSNGYPITIKCDDNQATPTKTIELKVDILTRKAILDYRDNKVDETSRITISDPRGENSSADIWIKSGSKAGNFMGQRTLSISAQRNETFRVTPFANFSLDLIEENGVFKATHLAMASGIPEFPDSMKQISLEFEKMSCVIEGL